MQTRAKLDRDGKHESERLQCQRIVILKLAGKDTIIRIVFECPTIEESLVNAVVPSYLDEQRPKRISPTTIMVASTALMVRVDSMRGVFVSQKKNKKTPTVDALARDKDASSLFFYVSSIASNCKCLPP